MSKVKGQRIKIMCDREGCGYVYAQDIIKPGDNLQIGLSSIVASLLFLHREKTGHSTIVSSNPNIIKAETNERGNVTISLVQ